MPMPAQKPGRSKQDYGTPWRLIHAIEARWGKLTIDLAARADNAKAPEFISPEENSLTRNWAQRIGDGLGFLNPEFDDIAPWVDKCAGCWAPLISLTPASIGAEWFANNCEHKAKIVGLRPRIAFYGCHVLIKNGTQKGERACDSSCLGCASYPKDCMLLLWGNRFQSEPAFQTWRWDMQTAKRRRKLYLAGPMTGLASMNHAAFIDAAVRLRFLGFDVISPAELNPPSRDWASALKVTIPALMRCDAVALLPGWEHSRGAALEVQLARQCEMELIPLVAETVKGKTVHKISPVREAAA
jgi:phage N-6-adenine-methyltransferase